MSNLIQLIRNEQMKLYSQKATWIMIIFLAVIVLVVGIFMKVDQVKFGTGDIPNGENWKQELQEQNELLQSESPTKEIEYPGFTDIEMNQYRIENDLKPTGYDAWRFLQDNRFNISLISLFTIIVSAGIVANEFKWGTIKLLLIRPISRTKILLSKYISVLLFAGTLLVFLYVFSFIVGALLFGIDGFAQTYVYRQNGEILNVPIFTHTLGLYLLSTVNLLMMTTLAFMISAVFRNASLAIGVSLFLLMAGSSITLFVADRDWAKYILFANTDLTVYVEGMPMIEGLTLGFSIIVLVVYYFIFALLTWLVFTKRDVAGA